MYYLYEILFPNGKRYLGITDYPARRWSAHKAAARRGSTKQKVHTAIRKHGEDKVSFKILVQGAETYIRELERKAIAIFQTRDHDYGYNQALGGEMSPVAGIGHSQESRAKMSTSQKNRVRSPDSWVKFATSNLGRPVGDEQRRKLGEAAKRRWDSLADRKLPKTREYLQQIKEMLAAGLSRKEVALKLGLSKAYTRHLILQLTEE